jgi:hypothetical protein
VASWRERRTWRSEFKTLGVRQTSERERISLWGEEKLREARRWLRAQDRRPYWIGVIGTILAAVIGALIAAIVVSSSERARLVARGAPIRQFWVGVLVGLVSSALRAR